MQLQLKFSRIPMVLLRCTFPNKEIILGVSGGGGGGRGEVVFIFELVMAMETEKEQQQCSNRTREDNGQLLPGLAY